MDLSSLFLLLLVFLPVAVFVGWPFLKHWHDQVESGHEISSLLAERDRIINAIQELDFDNSLGKIPADEFPVQRKALLQMGAEVLRKLDLLGRSNESNKRGENIAKDLAQYDSSEPGSGFISDEDIEEMIAKRRSIQKEKTSGFCPRCGRPLRESDRFCSSCGHAIDASSRRQEIA